MIRSILASALVALALNAVPAHAQRDVATDAQPALDDRYPDRITAWPGGVTSLADVVYQTIPGYRPQILDVYMPPRGAGAKPLVIYIHGGGWVSGHTRQAGAISDFPGLLARLAGEGFVVASVEYRLSDEAPFPAQVQDVRAALRFLKANAARYGIDPARVGLWGGSAGGHLAALTALSCGVGALDAPGTKAPAGSECVQAAVTWYGVFDVSALVAARPGGADGAIAKLLGCAGPCPADKLAAASPVTYIDAQDPPMLLIHGTDDQTVPVAQTHIAEAKLRAAGVPVQTIYIPGADHSFIGKTPAATHAATVQAVNATFDFLHARLDAPTH